MPVVVVTLVLALFFLVVDFFELFFLATLFFVDLALGFLELALRTVFFLSGLAFALLRALPRAFFLVAPFLGAFLFLGVEELAFLAVLLRGLLAVGSSGSAGQYAMGSLAPVPSSASLISSSS